MCHDDYLYAATIAVSNHQGKSEVSGLAEDDGKMRLPHTSWTSWIAATCNNPTLIRLDQHIWTMHNSHFPIKGKPANPFDTRCFRLTRYRRCWSLPASPLHPERTVGKEATRSSILDMLWLKRSLDKGSRPTAKLAMADSGGRASILSISSIDSEFSGAGLLLRS